MTITNGAQHSDARGSRYRQPPIGQILVGVHGVGSPSIAVVARDISQGYANAHPNDEIRADASNLSIDVGTEAHLYQGVRLTNSGEAVQIWEVNWSELKGLPATAIGSAFYALKTLLAMIQISDKGWDTESRGITGPLLTGFVLRMYFCTFSLIAPLNLLMVAYAYVQSNKPVFYGIILAFTVFVTTIIFWLTCVEHLTRYSLITLAAGDFLAIWLASGNSSDALLQFSIVATSILELLLGDIVLVCLLELLIRFILLRRVGAAIVGELTVYASRAGMVILAVTILVSAYGVLVNAAGFYLLEKFVDWRLATNQHSKDLKTHTLNS
jgi:hypothetical protein